MSAFTDLPESCRLNLDYRSPRQINGQNLALDGQAIDFEETWNQVPDADYVDFINVICGLPETFSTTLGAMTRVVPLRHWEFPWLLAKSFRATGYGVGEPSDDGLPARWPFYRVSVGFGSSPFATAGDKPFLTESVQPSARTIQLPASGARVGANPTVYDPGRTIHGQVYTLTAHQVGSLDTSYFRGYTGRTNTGAFFGNPQGTVKYLGPSGDSTSSFGETQTYTVSHVFDISDLPWNYAANPDGTFSLKTYTDGSLEFPYADFSALFI